MQLMNSKFVAVFLHALLIGAIPPRRRRAQNETSTLEPVSTTNITLTAQTQPSIDDISTTLMHETVIAPGRRVTDNSFIQPIDTGFVGLAPITITRANTSCNHSMAQHSLTRKSLLSETSFITVTATRSDTQIANTTPAQPQMSQPSVIIGGGSTAEASIQDSRDSTTSSIPTTSGLSKHLSEAKSSISNNPYPYPHYHPQSSTSIESLHKETTSPSTYNPYPYPHRHSTESESASAAAGSLTRETSSTSTY